MDDAARTALTMCMGLKKGESCLIITDPGKRDIGETFFNEARKITDIVKLVEMPMLKINGEEPPKSIAEEMKKYDVVMIASSKSISHTKARRDATASGARIASMPGITVDMARRTLNADYYAIRERTRKLVALHDAGKEIRITTPKGTDITMNIEGLHCRGGSGGILTEKGAFGNLPEGESNMAPVEGTSKGVFVVDKTMAGIGKVGYPIKFTVFGGRVFSIEGGEEAERLKKILRDMDDSRVYNIAEIGIGTNDKAIITGNTLEDEKVMGTCHIAIGNNMSYEGGTCDAALHLDGVMDSPTVWIDGRMIIEDGKFLF